MKLLSKIKEFTINRKLITSLLVALVLITGTFTYGVIDRDSGLLGKVSSVTKEVFTIGMAEVAYAAGSPDYTCDGVADDIQIQAALNALPTIGGRICILAGQYHLSATVSRAIDDVIIEGVGNGTNLANNSSTAIFSVGSQDGWQFRDLMTDAGGITTTSATTCSFTNVMLDSTYYAAWTSTDIIDDEYDVPDGQIPDFIVAANDSPSNVKKQANYICDGTADDVEIQAALDALSSGGFVQLTTGTYNIASTIELPGNTIFAGVGTMTVLNGAADSNTYRLVTNDDWDSGNVDITIKNMKLDGNFTAGSGALTGGGLHLVNVNGFHIENVESIDASKHCFEFVKCLNGLVEYCKGSLAGLSSAGDDIFSVSDGAYGAGGVGGTQGASVSRNITFYRCKAEHPSNSCFEVDDGPKFIYFTECVADNQSSGSGGFWIHYHTGEEPPTDIYWTRCRSYGQESSVNSACYGVCSDDVAATPGDLIENVHIKGCYGASGGTLYRAVKAIGVNYLTIEDCEFPDSSIYVGPVPTNNYVNQYVKIISNRLIASPAVDRIGIEVDDVYIDALISGNTLRGWVNAINVSTSNDACYGLRIVDNFITSGYGTDYGIVLAPGATGYKFYKAIITGNSIANQTSAFYIDGAANRFSVDYPITIKDNDCNDSFITYNGGVDSTYINYGDISQDHFQDVLAASSTYIRSNEDLSAALSIAFTLDAQPDVPRTLSWSFDSHVNITAFTITFGGWDARGIYLTEEITEADGWSGETSIAYAIVYTIVMSSRTGTGVGDTMDIGITDVLGLSGSFLATDDVLKIKKNTGNEVVNTAKVDVDYRTYDMVEIGLAGNDDFTIWFRNNTNIEN